MKSRSFLNCLILIVLFACSKDDNPLPPEEIPGTMQGVFIDSPVEGLRYETETHSGYTDENGTYDYEEGETVTFYAGEIKLGSAEATGELSPISIASTPNADIETLEVQNIAAFLQTLDLDGDPSNGILLNQEVVAVINLSEIDFTQNIIQILGEITIEVFQETGLNLSIIFPEMAALHLAQSLGVEYEPEPSFTLNFLPTFTNYYSQENKAINWLHEFDEQGRLIKSSKFEKYPFRINQEFFFNNYDDNNFKVEMEIKQYHYAHPNVDRTSSYELTYDENFQIKEIYYSSESDIYSTTRTHEFKELNENGWVTLILTTATSESQTDYQELETRNVFDYNNEGFLLNMNSYDLSGNLVRNIQNTFTNFGEIKSQIISIEESGKITSIEYSYRDDYTLQKIEYNSSLPNPYQRIIEYNENEAILKDTLKYNDNLQDASIDTYEAGVQTLFEWYVDGVIKQITYFEPDGNGGSFQIKIEEYGFDGILEKVYIYNSEGEVIETYCYNQGMEIDCN